MKPGFALDLSQGKIALLHRTGQGWVTVGEADFDDPALAQRLAVLRRTATGLAPHGLATKLILPASQILYTEIEAPGPDRASRRRQIAEALEGLTPYGREDLAFDWSRSGRRVQVAAVARLTLREAEDFAEAHRFNPVCFVAIPEPGQFAGEPFFGQTGRAAAVLPPGERLDRDQDPVRIIAAGGPPRASETAAAAPADDDRAADADAADADAGDADAGGAEATGAEATDKATPDATAGPADAGADGADDGPPTGDAAIVALDFPGRQPPADAETLPAGAEPPSTRPLGTGRAEPDQPRAIAATDPLAEISFQTRRPAIALSETTASPPAPGPGGAEDEGAATPHLCLPARLDLAGPEVRGPDPATGADPAIATRAGIIASDDDFAAGIGVTAPVVPVPARAAADDDLPPAAGPAAARPADRAPRRSPPAPGSRPAEPPRLRRTPVMPAAEAAAMTVFGARHEDAIASPPRHPAATGRRRPLLLVAVILGLLIAALALWLRVLDGEETTASRSRSEPDRAATLPPASPDPGAAAAERADLAPDLATRPRTDAVPASVTATGVTAAPRAPEPAVGADPLPATATRPTVPAEPAPAPLAPGAAPAGEIATVPEPDPAPAPAADAPPAPQATPPTATAAAGPQPDAPGAPTVTTAEPLPALTAPDRFADTAAAEAAPRPLPLPPAFGKLVRYDPQGLIVATPEGVVTPEGFTLIAGQPPRLPATRPQSVEAAAAPLADRRPHPRPADLTSASTPAPDADPDSGPVAGPAADEAATPDPGLGASIEAALAEAARVAPQPGPAADAAMLSTAPPAVPAPPVDPAHAALAPRPRPAAVAERAASAAAIRAAAEAASRAEAEARAAALASATAQAVASSRRPAGRPQSFARAVEAALAAAAADSAAGNPEAVAAAVARVPAAAPEDVDEPEPTAAAPASSRTTVARQATLKNAIDLGDMNLIGVYGSAANRRALVRMPGGRYVKLKVGDRFDGGQVAAIGDSELRYVKNGRTVVLKILKNG